MGWRSVIITQHAKMTYSMNMMVVQTRDGINQIPIADINLLLVSTTQAVITSALISKLAENQTKVIFVDEKDEPVVETVGYYPGARNLSKLNNQFNWDLQLKEKLWTKIVDRKITNQIAVLKNYQLEWQNVQDELDQLELNDATNREAIAARKYFMTLFDKTFIRRDNNAVNGALDYGYAILLASFNREIAVNGYLSYLGIHHHSGIKILATRSAIVYRDLVQGIQGKNKMLICSSDNYDPVEVTKTFDMVGDPLLSGDITKKYLTKIVSTYITNLDEATRNKIFCAFSNLELALSDSLLLEDLPLAINFDEDLKKLLKMADLHLDENILSDSYAIIETVLKIHQNCNLKTVPVFCNATNYLDNRELAELAQIAKQMKLMVVLIEFTSSDFLVVPEDAQFYYIDEDLVDWY